MMMKIKRQRISREVFSSLSRATHTASSPLASLKCFTMVQMKKNIPFTVTVSKKEIPTAVKRNLIKRRYTSILQKLLNTQDHSIALQAILKKKALTALHKELIDDTIGLLAKIGL